VFSSVRQWIANKPATIARVANVRRSLLVDAIAGDDRHIVYGSKRLSICRDLCFDSMAMALTPVKLRRVDRLRIATSHAEICDDDLSPDRQWNSTIRGGKRSGRTASLHPAQRARAEGREVRLRPRAVRRMHGDDRGRSGPILPDARVEGRRPRGDDAGRPRLARPHRVQAAFIAEQAAQCGYCSNGMIMTSAALLAREAKPDAAKIKDALAGNLCRCGTHDRIVKAVLRAAGRA
jgi:hypothetical protein